MSGQDRPPRSHTDLYTGSTSFESKHLSHSVSSCIKSIRCSGQTLTAELRDICRTCGGRQRRPGERPFARRKGRRRCPEVGD